MRKISQSFWLALFTWLVIFRISLWVYLKLSGGIGFGNGNDSNYYHSAATGEIDIFTSAWPVLLRGLNNLNLYDRDLVSLVLFLFSTFLIPILFVKAIKPKYVKVDGNYKWVAIILLVTYPTIFFFSLDLYRDIIIYTLALVVFVVARSLIEGSSYWAKGFYILLFMLVGWVCYSFRDYFGVAVIFSLPVYYLYGRTSKYFKSWIVVYFLSLILLMMTGMLDELLLYRGVEGFEQGGATFGIGLYGRDPLTFTGLYLVSFFYQMFGTYLVNLPTLFVFFTESLIFIVAFFYVLKNREYMSRFAKYLMVFFIMYSTIWILGNDNLGTAVRLRVPSYLAIYAIAFIIKQRKVI